MSIGVNVVMGQGRLSDFPMISNVKNAGECPITLYVRRGRWLE